MLKFKTRVTTGPPTRNYSSTSRFFFSTFHNICTTTIIGCTVSSERKAVVKAVQRTATVWFLVSESSFLCTARGRARTYRQTVAISPRLSFLSLHVRSMRGWRGLKREGGALLLRTSIRQHSRRCCSIPSFLKPIMTKKQRRNSWRVKMLMFQLFFVFSFSPNQRDTHCCALGLYLTLHPLCSLSCNTAPLTAVLLSRFTSICYECCFQKLPLRRTITTRI